MWASGIFKDFQNLLRGTISIRFRHFLDLTATGFLGFSGCFSENVDPDVALALRRQGIDVMATREMGLLGQPDEVQLAFACEQGRMIVTHDTDFLRLD